MPLILLSLLLIPTESYGLLIFSHCLFVVFLILIKKEIHLDLKALIIFIIFSSFVLFVTIYFKNSDFRNITEILRFLPIVCLFMFKVLFKYEDIYSALKYYTLALFLFCILQVFFKELILVDFLTNIYSSNLHIDKSLGIGNRALGFSNGPGQNAVIAILLLFFFLSNYFHKNSKSDLLLSILSFFVLLLTQNQTGFIAFAIGFLSITYIFWSSISLNIKIGLVYFSVIITLFIVYLATIINLRYLFSLFEVGLERSSFINRLEKWDTFLGAVHESPFVHLFGHGKSFFGPSSGAMDGEFIFFYTVYGLLISSFYVVLISYIFIRSKVFKFNYRYKLVLAICIPGLILSIANSFLLDPRVLMLLALMECSHEKNSYFRSS